MMVGLLIASSKYDMFVWGINASLIRSEGYFGVIKNAELLHE